VTVGACTDVRAYGLNNNDEMVGYCADATGDHAFVKALSGAFILYDAPVATVTNPFAINLDGYMAGSTQDASGVHGVFTDGTTWTPINVPGGTQTLVWGLNASNTMSGQYFSADATMAHGFISPDGVSFTTLDYPGVPGQTYAHGLSDSGQVVGYFHGPTDNRGFVYDGATWTPIDVPGASATVVFGISPDGRKLVGAFQDATGVHGFLATVEAADTTPPTITATANPSQLWPPNGQMVPVTVSGSMTDSGSGVDPATASYTVLDEYGLIQPSGPITLQPNGSYRFTVALQASRRGQDQDGRHYTIAVSARDQAGNLGVATAMVVVPHG
jgi:hypothetical protein